MIPYEIEQLIPQRAPIRMVDRLLEVSEGKACCGLLVNWRNRFLELDGSMSAEGVIEHIAQSASALFGYEARQAGREAPPLAYIGEVRNFRCLRRPHAGEWLQTTIRTGPTVGDVTLLTAEVKINDEVIALTELKIAMV
ncbi:MAG: beta-hydroxyacyl-ACP dehydratase [Parabacteroides sp.]